MDKFYVNIHKYGNSSAASIPIALAEAVAQETISPGDLVMMIGFGAGLSWGVTVMQTSCLPLVNSLAIGDNPHVRTRF